MSLTRRGVLLGSAAAALSAAAGHAQQRQLFDSHNPLALYRVKIA